MAAPIIENVRLDRATYIPGEEITLKFDAYDPDSQTVEVTVTVKDNAGHTGTATVPLIISDPVSVTVSDTTGRVWEQVNQDATVYTFGATA